MKTTKQKSLVLLLIILTETVVALMTGEHVRTFLPENAGIPGQHGLQQHRCISLGFIATQVVFQLSGKHTGRRGSSVKLRKRERREDWG